MESGGLTKTTKSENYDIELKCWVFATANNKDYILEPLSDRFEIYYLTDYTDDEFRVIAVKRLWQEGVKDEELALYVAIRYYEVLEEKDWDAIKIARKYKTVEQVDETVQTMTRYGKRWNWLLESIANSYVFSDLSWAYLNIKRDIRNKLWLELVPSLRTLDQ